ncbi:MAG: glycosyltransferase 2 family protein [Thermoplasmata archaeon]|nr:glycosyltransferase 2 family protein [Thermoplasmata archaeon]
MLPGDVPVTEPEAEASPESAFRKYRRLVPWAVGLSLATLILLSVWFQARRGGDVLAELSRVQPSALAAALGLHILMQVAWATRIYVLGRGLGARVSLPRALTLVTAGLFAAAVTPGRVGGEPWRIAMLVRGGASGAAASRTIVADRAVDMLFFLALGAIAIALLPSFFGSDVGDVRILGLVALLGLLGIAVAIGFILVRPAKMALALGRLAGLGDRLLRRPRKERTPAIAAFFHEVTGGIGELLRRRPSAILAGAVLSFVLWTCELSILWVVLKGFGFDPPYFAAYLAGVLIVMVASVPALPGGTGVAEVAALALLTPLAPGLTPAFLVAWRGMTYYVDLLAGGLTAGWVARQPAAARPPPASS